MAVRARVPWTLQDRILNLESSQAAVTRNILNKLSQGIPSAKIGEVSYSKLIGMNSDNMIGNPSFEQYAVNATDDSHYYVSGGGTWDESSSARTGGDAARLIFGSWTTDALINFNGYDETTDTSRMFSCREGDEFFFEFYTRRSGANGTTWPNVQAEIRWFDSAGSLLSTTAGASSAPADFTYERRAVTGTAPASAAFGVFSARVVYNASANALDGVLIDDAFARGRVYGEIVGDLQSDNFSTGVSGWQILENGTVEFQDATLRGTITATGGSITGDLQILSPGRIYVTDGTSTLSIDENFLQIDHGSSKFFTFYGINGTTPTNVIEATTAGDIWIQTPDDIRLLGSPTSVIELQGSQIIFDVLTSGGDLLVIEDFAAGDFRIRNTGQNNALNFYDGTGGIGFSYNGTEGLRYIANSPATFEVQNLTADYLRIATAHGNIDIGSRNVDFAHIYTDRPTFAINATIAMVGSGDLGTSSHPVGNIHFGNNDYIDYDDANNRYNFISDGATLIRFTNNAGLFESMRLFDSQADNIIVWSNNPYTNGTGDYQAYWDNDIDGANVGWGITTTLSSGAAIKTNIRDYDEDGVAAAFLRIPMRSWEYNAEAVKAAFPSRNDKLDGHMPKDDDGPTRHWYVADEVEAELPWLVGQPDGDSVKRIKDGRPLQVAMIAALRHLNRRVEQLEAGGA